MTQVTTSFSCFSLIPYRQPPYFKRTLTSDKPLNTTLIPFPAMLPNDSFAHISRPMTSSQNLTTKNELSTLVVLFTLFAYAAVYFVLKLNILEKLKIGSKNETTGRKICHHKKKPVAQHFNLPDHYVSCLQVPALKRTQANGDTIKSKTKNYF